MSLQKDAKAAFEYGLSYGDYISKKERGVLEPAPKVKQRREKLPLIRWFGKSRDRKG